MTEKKTPVILRLPEAAEESGEGKCLPFRTNGIPHSNILVYYEETGNVESAIKREKQIKGWLRKKKIALIESANPFCKDLAEEWYD